MLVRIEEITVGVRKRKLESAQLPALAESIREIGLLSPITLTSDLRLIAGLHRLEACRRLGWEQIEASIRQFDELHTRLAEIDENLIRNELTELEQAVQLAERKEIYEAMHPETKRGGDRGNQHTGGKKRQNDKISFCHDTAEKTGKTERAIQYKAKVGKALTAVADKLRGTAIEDNQQELLKLSRMEEQERHAVVERIASGAATCVRQAVILGQVQAMQHEPAPFPTGPFRVIVIDPPWRYNNRADDPTHRAANPYPSMSLEEIQALPIKNIAADDAILWLWATNAHLPEAFTIAAAWGFEYKTLLTWVKDRIGFGEWLRGQTEHCLMATRGKPFVLLTNQATVIVEPLREHSRKPASFYTLVESLCPGSKVELFSRETREGWQAYGDQTGLFSHTANRGPCTCHPDIDITEIMEVR